MLRMTLLAVFSLGGCATKLPNAYLNVVNSPGLHLKGYNIAKDYDSEGRVIKSAKPRYITARNAQEFLEILNKGVWVSNDDWAKIKVSLRDARRACEK